MGRSCCRVAAALAFCALRCAGQTSREAELLTRIEALEKRLAEVEAKLTPAAPKPAEAAVAAPATTAPTPAPAPAPVDVNLMLDAYYGWNFNRPPVRANPLRVFDASHNNLSVSQAVVSLERAPDPASGRRLGGRVDLQFGQATEALGANPLNEPRPAVWRHLLQAYGTYVAPVGRGLTVDFGRWLSAIGPESPFNKDQVNYSRSLLFAFLPAYHTGLRVAYDFSDRFGAGYWLVNGIGQGDDFNGAKSQNFQLRIKPVKAINWTTNYYTGNENPDPDGAAAVPMPRGRTHIVDTYAAWTVNPRLTLGGEFDCEIRRMQKNGAPVHLTGEAAYARYQLTPRFALGARAEYLGDHGGLFTNVQQAVKEATLTADYLLAGGFLMRWEWRRDWSNRAFFPDDRPGNLKKEQNTATLGLVWWFGPRTGSW